MYHVPKNDNLSFAPNLLKQLPFYFFLGDHEIGSQEILDYCYRILDQSLLSFIYQFIVNDGPNPFEFDKFCNDFKKKNVSIIVVEMATDAITVATKDKKFTFESQVSNIGM